MPLLDGKSLSGWRPLDGVSTSSFHVVEGQVEVRRSLADTVHTVLRTEQTWTSFELTADVRARLPVLAGVVVAGQGGDSAKEPPRGLLLILDPMSGGGQTGALFELGGKGWLAEPHEPDPALDRSAAARAWRPLAWNTIKIRVLDGRVRTWINDHDASDHALPSHGAEGWIGLFMHTGPQGAITWKNIRIRTPASS